MRKHHGSTELDPDIGGEAGLLIERQTYGREPRSIYYVNLPQDGLGLVSRFHGIGGRAIIDCILTTVGAYLLQQGTDSAACSG